MWQSHNNDYVGSVMLSETHAVRVWRLHIPPGQRCGLQGAEQHASETIGDTTLSFITVEVLEQRSANLNHLMLPEVKDFNALSEAT